MIRRRQEAVVSYGILDPRPEPAVQRLLAIASQVCSTPMSRLSLVNWDAQRVFTRAFFGGTIQMDNISFDEYSSRHMFCLQCIRGGDPEDGGIAEAPLVVNNTEQHPDFCKNVFVQQGLVRFYLGVPLTTPSGIPIGALCVIDSKPRTIPSHLIHTLSLLARQVMSHYEYRREHRILSNTLAEREALRFRLRQVLGGILPCHVIASIKRRQKPPEDFFDPVTVCFSDIVGFKEICASVPPTTVLHMLDRLYSAMDRLVAKHGLFKVETIGDVFVCCGGMLEPQPDHTLRVAMFAVEAVVAAAKVPIDPHDASKGCVAIRVGFHTGPVVANVVGMSRPRYCLFGDTVNTAARMQTASHAERINMSPAAASTLKLQCAQVCLEERSPMFIKGKGEMTMYFLDSRSLRAAPQKEEIALVPVRCVKRSTVVACPATTTTARDCMLGAVA
ncbi:hypothetical protein AeMF1_003253 [Aphanomyces euteiches]|nr:hypothetical protein AeMF1_003253 [Aphanomyces euteiches]KAH9195024.1 hypothetical protein AeNC1_002981 [Aphanomyces euteiches]